MQQITLIENAIHRPDEPRHFMEYSYPSTRYLAIIDERVVGDSKALLKLSEVGMHIYDPVLYFPLVDLQLGLLRISDKTSHCPLKGDTNYYDFVDGETVIDAVGWCYSKPLNFAKTLANYVAFDARKVKIIAQD